MVRKEGFMLVLVLLLGLSGCMGKKDKKAQRPKSKKVSRRQDSFSQVDMQLAGDNGEVPADESVRSFFDQDADEFVLLTPDEEEAVAAVNDAGAQEDAGIKADEFAWVDAVDDQEYKVINFDFDKSGVRADQKEKLAYDVEQAKKLLDESKEGATIVLEGHACSSAGSRTYNLGLSERRAKEVADCFTAANVPVKIVGRGAEVPVIIDGDPIVGDKEQQAPNRRVEMHVVYS